MDNTNSNPHVSGLPIGTAIPVKFGRKAQVAVLFARVPHGEDWRVKRDLQDSGYTFSTGYRWVTEHAIN
jgi:hypothetical protein